MPTTNDDAYNNRARVPDVDAFVARWEQEAHAFRQALAEAGRAELGHAYGAHRREALDVFRPEGTPRGLMIFVHGGYWLRFDRSYWSHYAQAAVGKGWAVAMPSYPVCPEVRIAQITRSIAACVTEASSMVEGPITLAGHSAGGHLVARMLNPDARHPTEVTHRLHHVAVLSCVSDLRPLIDTSMNADFQLDDAAAIAESPALQAKALDIPVSIWVGANERPAFLDQSRWLAEAWQADLHEVAGRHHFDVIDPLLDPQGEMITTLLG